MLKRAALIGLIATAALGLAPTAQAAAPTRIVDRTIDVICTAVSEDVEITVAAARSDLAGTDSAVQLSYASTGETIGGFVNGDSDWGDGTFKALIPVLDLNDRQIGEVYFAGRYSPAGGPVQTQDKFNVGNVHVVEEHSETPLTISDVVLQYGDLTFDDPTCAGSMIEGSLFFTNPATVVQFGSDLLYFPDQCTADNIESWTIEGTLDELFVEVIYADRPEATAGGLIVPEGGSWQGQFRLQISDEPAGTVDASATLERSGPPSHATEGKTGMRNHLQVTPYHFTLDLEGPDASATLDCTLYQVRQKLHYLNPNG